MHLIEITKADPTFPANIKAGEQYLIDDINAGELLHKGQCKVHGYLGHGKIYSEFDDRFEFEEGSLLLIRAGGFGDLLFMTPTIRELKKSFTKVSVACFDRYRHAASGVCENFEDYPVVKSIAQSYGTVIGFDGIMENEWAELDAENTHAIDLFAQACGVKLTDRSLSVRQPDPVWLAAQNSVKKAPRIGIQVYSSSVVRTYPERMTGELILELSKLGFEVFLFGGPGEVRTSPTSPKNVVNLCERLLTFEQSIAMLTTCDALIAPDSSLCHVAAALKIPTVALYGPFPSSLRVSDKCIKPLEGHLKCAPCFTHGHALPKGKPCSRLGYCEALANIPVKSIIKTLKTSYDPKRKIR
ncbi:MAG: hypothetical protein D4R57_01140 [Verrucomicrobiales bacterium]|nr:MAG: hypothetical protein D4R57_01140 [Verrucomicrobiales bacterium]